MRRSLLSFSFRGICKLGRTVVGHISWIGRRTRMQAAFSMPRKSRSAPGFGLFAASSSSPSDVAGVVSALDDLDRQRHQHYIWLDRSLSQRANFVGHRLRRPRVSSPAVLGSPPDALSRAAAGSRCSSSDVTNSQRNARSSLHARKRPGTEWAAGCALAAKPVCASLKPSRRPLHRLRASNDSDPDALWCTLRADSRKAHSP